MVKKFADGEVLEKPEVMAKKAKYIRERYASDPSYRKYMKKFNATYYEEHKNTMIRRARKRNNTNDDEYRDYQKSYYEKNKEKLKQYQKRYKKKNKEKVALYMRKYRKKKLST